MTWSANPNDPKRTPFRVTTPIASSASRYEPTCTRLTFNIPVIKVKINCFLGHGTTTSHSVLLHQVQTRMCRVTGRG